MDDLRPGGESAAAQHRLSKPADYSSGRKNEDFGRETECDSNGLTFYANLITQTLVRIDNYGDGQGS